MNEKEPMIRKQLYIEPAQDVLLKNLRPNMV